jgi:hypothetical protein
LRFGARYFEKMKRENEFLIVKILREHQGMFMVCNNRSFP